MAFLVKDLAVALTEEDRGWGLLIACGAQSTDDEGCGPNTQNDARFDPKDLLWGDEREADLKTLRFLLAQAIAYVEGRIASLNPAEDTERKNEKSGS